MMKTLDYSRTGAIIGGPVGGAIGAGVGLYEDLFGGGRPDVTEAQRTNEIKNIRQVSASFGQVVKLVFGTTRIAPVVTMLPRESFTHHVTQGDNAYVAGYALGLGLCEGPIYGIGACWRDGVVYDSLTDFVKSEDPVFQTVLAIASKALPLAERGVGTWTLKTGALDQTAFAWPDPFLDTSNSSVVYSEYAYPGTAWIAHTILMLVSEGTMISSVPNLQFEVKGIGVGASNRDAEASAVLNYLLTDPRFGCGIATSRIDATSLEKFRQYAGAMGFGISWAIEQQQPAIELVKTLLDACNCSAVDSGGKLKLIPYGDQDITANGYTYTADHTPVYDLTDEDFIVTEGQQPIRIERRSEQSCANTIPVEYVDGKFTYSDLEGGKRAASAYEKTPIESPVTSDVIKTLSDGNRKGVIRGPAIPLHCFTSKDAALKRSRLYAQRSVGVRCRFTVRLSWKFILLEKGDLVRIQSDAMGLSQRVVRVVGRQRDRAAGSQGEIELRVEDAPFGVYTSSAYSVQEGDATAGTPSSESAASVSAPTIFMPPQRSADGHHYVWVAASGDATVGGADVWYSWDQNNYDLAGSISNGACAIGTLSLPLAVGAPLDETNTLAVTRVSGALGSVTEQDRDDLVTRCWVDHEILSFKTVSATDTTWSITSLRRGCEGTESRAHSADTEFVRMDEAPVRIAIDDERRGQTLYIKCLSWNRTHTRQQTLAEATEYSFLVPGRYLTGKLPITITWDDFDREDWDLF